MKTLLAGVAVLTMSCGLAMAQYDTKGAKDAATKAAGHETAKLDIVDIAASSSDFTTLVAAVKAAGLAEALKGKGPFTVFAPTNDAFKKLPAGTVETLLKPENKDKLANLLKYHVVGAKVLAKDVATMPAETLSGQAINIVAKDGKVTVDGATVTKTDLVGSNGVIHVIDTVIMPADKNIVETAVAAGSFKTLATLLDKAGLVDALKGPGPFTVFAPTDEAFAKLPKETVDSLLKPENKAQLAAILKFHVIPGRVYSTAAAKGATVATLEGSNVTTQSSAGKVTVQNATITGVDIDASNGVIHVIDTVILPKQ